MAWLYIPKEPYEPKEGDIKVMSICTGYGGAELGLRLAVPRARTICMVEREGFLIEHLEQAMEKGLMGQAPVHSDAKTFDGKPWHRKVDILHSSYPCQPFSIAGRRLGAADPRHLWPTIARIVDEVGAPYCFFENVDDHLRLGFDQVAQDLDAMGYVVEAGIFSSAETGASHVRERLYIMAFSAERERAAGAEIRGVPGPLRGDRTERDNADRPGGVLDAACEPGRTLGLPKVLGHERSWGTRDGRAGSTGDGRQMAHADGPGLPQRDGEQGSEGPKRSGGRGGEAQAKLWTTPCTDDSMHGRHRHPEEDMFAGRLRSEPPGRNDERGWRESLESHPYLAPKLPVETQPGISRMVNEIAIRMAYRVDRVRAIGNGLDPVVFAVAFSTLWHRIHG